MIGLESVLGTEIGPISLAWYEMLVAGLSLTGLGGLVGYLLANPEPEPVEGTINVDDLPEDVDPERYVQLDPPDIAASRFGAVGVLYALYKHHVRRRKLARKGYVQQFRVENGVLTGPHYVRPELNFETNIPEVDIDEGTYLFPDEAMVPDRRSGMWTAIHREGQADPINLRDADADAIPAEAAKKWADMKVTSSKPGWLGDLDLDSQTIMAIGLVVVLVLAVLMGGGV